MEECPVNRCNQPEGHEGPHGAAIVPGFVIGPFGQTGKGRKCDELTDIVCDACSESSLKVIWRNENDIGGVLECTGKCDQEHVINADASGSCVLKTLYPSSWKRGCKQWPHYIEERVKSARHYSQMCRILNVSYDLQHFIDSANNEIREHNELVIGMPWWKKLWELVK